MNAKRLGKYQRQLYSRMPLIGGWLRRRAAQTLAQDSSPEAVRALAEAVTRSNDERVRGIALERIRHIDTQPCINAVCAVWAATRHPDLTALLTERGWVASAPPDVKVLSALKTKRLEWVTEGDADVVEPLARACEDGDPTIAEQARLALRQLKNLDAHEALCRLVIEYNHPLAREIAVTAQYAPRAPHQRALFYFLTGQWDKYESLDFDQTMLGTAYEICDERLRKRIAECVRRAGRVEWVKIVAGGRQGRRLGEMTDGEWEAARSVLGSSGRWEDMWHLAQMAPVVWSVRLLRRLREVGWVPEGKEERARFAELVWLAGRCMGEAASELSRLVHCQARLEGHKGVVGVDCLAISPDGRLLASGSGLAFNPDGRPAISPEGRLLGGEIRLWSLPNGTPLKTLEGHVSVKCLAISPDGRLLASGGSWEGVVRLWSLPDGTLLKTLEGHGSDAEGHVSVASLTISPDGRLLASGGVDGKIRLWTLPDGAPLKTLHTGLGCLAISPDGRLLVSGGVDGKVRLASLPDGVPLKTLEGHTKWIRCLTISPDGQMLASGGGDGVVWLWSLPDGAPLKMQEGHTFSVECLAISPDGWLLASGSYDKTVRLWRLPDGAVLKTLEGHTAAVVCLAISPDGRLLASGGVGLRLWRLPDGVALRTLEGRRLVYCLAISPDGRLLASGNDYDDTAVQLWDLEPLRLSYLPIGQMSLEDMAWVQEALRDGDISDAERGWLESLLALMRWQRRFDIEVEEAPWPISVGEFDIELGE